MANIIDLPNNKKGEIIEIEQTNERWSEIILKDETILKVKTNVLEVYKIIDEYDPTNGNPLYAIKSTPILVTNFVLDKIKQKK